MGRTELTVLADRGYYSGRQVLESTRAGMVPYVPKPLTSGAKAESRFGKQDFVYLPGEDVYRCPAGERLTWRFDSVENEMTLRSYWTDACSTCAIKSACTTGKQRRIKRWEHEAVLDAMQKRLDQVPQAMVLRRQTESLVDEAAFVRVTPAATLQRTAHHLGQRRGRREWAGNGTCRVVCPARRVVMHPSWMDRPKKPGPPGSLAVSEVPTRPAQCARCVSPETR